MRKLIAWAIASLCVLCTPAWAANVPVYTNESGQLKGAMGVVCVNPVNGALESCAGGGTGATSAATATSRAGTLTTGGTAQTAIAASVARLSWCIENPVDAAEVLVVASGFTPSATVGVQLQPGGQACDTDKLDVKVWAATTGHSWTGSTKQ